MSFGELLVVAIVAILVMKPEDIPIILQKFHQLKSYFANIKQDISAYLNKELAVDKDLREEFEQINFYLQKIIELNGTYEEEYSLQKVKAKYHQLIAQKMSKEKLDSKIKENDKL